MRVCVIYFDERDDVCISIAKEINTNPKIIKFSSLERLREECKECDVVVLRDLNTLFGHLPTYISSIGKKTIIIR